jgi:hypothetical protein
MYLIIYINLSLEPSKYDNERNARLKIKNGKAGRTKFMAHTYAELKQKTAAQLKEIAAGIEHDAVHGYTQMHKDHLVKAICTAFDIEMHEHHEVLRINKTAIKTHIKALKKERDQALKKHKHTELKKIRKKIKNLKNRLRSATV